MANLSMVPNLCIQYHSDLCDKTSHDGHVIKDTMKERCFPELVMHSFQRRPPLLINGSSSERFSGGCLRSASSNLNCSACPSRTGSYPDEDDGSIASRVLSLRTMCKSSSMFAPGGSSPEKKSPKIRGIKFEYCTEGLGSESSDITIPSFSQKQERGILRPTGETKLSSAVEAKSVRVIENQGEDNCIHKRNLPSERIRTPKCCSKFPPPLSTLTRKVDPHASDATPNAAFTYLQPYRMDGRLILQEVRVPCRDFLRVSRKDDCLRMDLITYNYEAKFGCLPRESCRGSLLEEAQANLVDESSRMEDNDVLDTVADLQVGEEPKEERKEGEGTLSNINSSELMEDTRHKTSCPMSPRMEQAAMALLRETNLKFFCIDRDKKNLVSKQQNYVVELLDSTLQDPLEQQRALSGEGLEMASFKTSPPHILDSIQLGSSKQKMQQLFLQETEEENGNLSQKHGKTKQIQSRISTQKMPVSLQSTDERWYEQIKQQEGVVTVAPAVKDDAVTTFSAPFNLPTLLPSDSKYSSPFSDLKLSFTRMHMVIINSAESHVSCKNVLDENSWKKGMPPLLGLPLRC